MTPTSCTPFLYKYPDSSQTIPFTIVGSKTSSSILLGENSALRIRPIFQNEVCTNIQRDFISSKKVDIMLLNHEQFDNSIQILDSRKENASESKNINSENIEFASLSYQQGVHQLVNNRLKILNLEYPLQKEFILSFRDTSYDDHFECKIPYRYKTGRYSDEEKEDEIIFKLQSYICSKETGDIVSVKVKEILNDKVAAFELITCSQNNILKRSVVECEDLLISGRILMVYYSSIEGLEIVNNE